jgi:hypothetical protein
LESKENKGKEFLLDLGSDLRDHFFFS